MSNGLTCISLKNAKSQIALLVTSYVGLKVWIMPVVFNNGFRECKVYVQLPPECQNLEEHEYNADYGYWGAHLGRVNREGKTCAAYLFKWDV